MGGVYPLDCDLNRDPDLDRECQRRHSRQHSKDWEAFRGFFLLAFCLFWIFWGYLLIIPSLYFCFFQRDIPPTVVLERKHRTDGHLQIQRWSVVVCIAAIWHI